MVVEDKLTKSFLEGSDLVDKIFRSMRFQQFSFVKKGFSYFVQYKKQSAIVEILYGPPEYHIDCKIITPRGTFSFKDLLQIPQVKKWVNSNRYKQQNGRDIKKELLWFMDFFKYSLSILSE